MIEGEADTGFSIRRIYYLFDVPGGMERGAHAHRNLQQCMVVPCGGVTVNLDNGGRREQIRLGGADKGLLIGPYVWRELSDFAEGTIVIVAASEHYEESDYLRKYDEFLRIVR